MQNNICFIFYILLLLFINILIINSQNTNEKNFNDTKVDPQRKEAEEIMRNFSDEWSTKMQDYRMEYLYYIPINPRDQEVYFENITTAPTNFSGAFFIADESTDKISFYIKDSYDKIVYRAVGHYNIFEIPIKRKDVYTITFRNNFQNNKVVVTFTMNTGQNNLLNSKDLTNTEKKLDNLEAVINKFNMEFKLSRDIHTKRYISKS